MLLLASGGFNHYYHTLITGRDIRFGETKMLGMTAPNEQGVCVSDKNECSLIMGIEMCANMCMDR